MDCCYTFGTAFLFPAAFHLLMFDMQERTIKHELVDLIYAYL